MRKFPVIIALLAVCGIAYALVPNLFPNTTNLPRIPSGDGTIGGVITRILGTSDLGSYLGDGTVPNTLKLDGNTATGYLRPQTPCGGTDKWVGLDADGNMICGSINPAPSDYGQIIAQDCEADVYHPDNTSGLTNTGDTLEGGDIIQTAPGCTLTIGFTDLSIIRLDGDTVVAFDLGYLPDGSTIASALLENGSLWGRILTETGSYTVGTREIIAGVRGTSIALVSTGRTITDASFTFTASGWQITQTPTVHPTAVTIVDTVSNAGAAKVYCVPPIGGPIALPDLPREGSYILPPGGCIVPVGPMATSILPTAVPAGSLYASSPWILENTAKDIEYMYDIIAISGSTLSPTMSGIINNEIATTIPPRDGTGALTTTGSTEANLLCIASGGRWWNDRFRCQPLDILAIADYTRPDPACSAVGGASAIYIYTGGTLLPPLCPLGATGTQTPRGWDIGINGGITYFQSSIITTIGGLNGKTLYFSINDKTTIYPSYIGSFKPGPPKYISFFQPDNYKCNGSAKSYGLPSGSCGYVSGTGSYITGSYRFDGDPNQFIIGNTDIFNLGLDGKIETLYIK